MTAAWPLAAVTHVRRTFIFSSNERVAPSPREPSGTIPVQPASSSQRQCFVINAWSTCRFASKQVVIAGITPFQFIDFLALLRIAQVRPRGWFRDSEALLGRPV